MAVINTRIAGSFFNNKRKREYTPPPPSAETNKKLLDELKISTKDADLKKQLSNTNEEIRTAAQTRLNQLIQGRVDKISQNPQFNYLPDDQKMKIASDLTHPLNPDNPNSLYETNTAEGKLAESERIQKEALARQQKGQIEGFAGEYENAATSKRASLAKALADKESQLRGSYETELGKYGQDLASSRQKTFETANPFILEDLNKRGLFNSSTAVSGAQAEKLKELEAGDEAKLGQARLGLFGDLQDYSENNANTLNQFDTNTFNEGQDIKGQGLSALIGGNQDALDSALSLRRMKLENDYNASQSASDRAFADSMAKKQRRNDLLTAGIGAAGAVSSAAVTCFSGETEVEMVNGEHKLISEIKVGDETRGGRVISFKVAETPDGTMYDYLGINVTGYHAVKEGDSWMRVKDSEKSVFVPGVFTVYTYVTNEHRIFINGIEFADEVETDDAQYIPLDYTLRVLNNQKEMIYA